MAVSIEQSPLYSTLPIGQQVIFALSNDPIVANYFKVKFIAKMYVSSVPINTSNSAQYVGTFKTTPNNVGVGMFDFRSVLETFLKPDYEGSTFGLGSTYKTLSQTHPMHLIDKYAVSENSIRYFAIKFDIEYALTETGDVLSPEDQLQTEEINTLSYLMFNGVIQYDDILTHFGDDYGYSLIIGGGNFFLNNSTANFLTNSPTTQYARLTDYGTLPFLNFLPTSSFGLETIVLTYYNEAGGVVGTDSVIQTVSTGGVAYAGGYAFSRLMYFGAFPANLQGWSSAFNTLVAAGSAPAYYTLYATNMFGVASETYRINIICPNERGYEGIRLTWLNQWGGWDYYTFNMKSTRSINTKRVSYTQLEGTWNESTFKVSGYKGGKKNFKVNSTERIKLNTDFVSEDEGVWFEELINSNEVYILNGLSADQALTITNKYIEPVVITTSKYIKKTIANDKLMQYTFEIEKSKTRRTQAV
mgnify:CR=1 FL=1|tara:strand:- start:793 stop:2208 length:1416 start_codon:yes stop_codon:yes gene_type:complete